MTNGSTRATTDPPSQVKETDVAGIAVGAIAVVTAATAIVGGFTGGVARVARNGPNTLPAVVGLVFLAAVVALIATSLPRSGKTKRDYRWSRIRLFWLVISLLLFGTAAIVVANALSRSLATTDRPIIQGSWVSSGGAWHLKGTVKASGLKTTDKLKVVVVRAVITRNTAPVAPTVNTKQTAAPKFTAAPHWFYSAGIVYQQVVGADINGNVNLAFDVPLPKGYDGLMVVASLGDVDTCPNELPSKPPAVNSPYSCLLLDGPMTSISSSKPAASKTRH
jgi:hypothetical protein